MNSCVALQQEANAYLRQGRIVKALATLQELKQRNWSNKETEINIARIFVSMSRYDEADEILKTLIDHVAAGKEEWQVWIDSSIGKARQIGNIPNWRESKLRCENGLTKFPDHWPFAQMLTRTYFNLGDEEKAIKLCNEYFDKTGEVDFLIGKINLYRLNFDYEEAARQFNEFCMLYPEDDKYSIIKAPLFRYVMDDKEKAYDLLSRFPPSGRDAECFFISLLIETGRKAQAMQLIDDFEFPRFQTLNEIIPRSWKLHQQKKYSAAKQLWESYHNNREDYRPSLHARIHTLKQLDSKEISFAPNDIVLFTVVKNELERLPWFLKYYRDLGVDKFIFIDNDSSDGSAEYILGQADSHLFWTDDDYGAAASGMRWINELVTRHINSQWFLYVDIDEFLVFPGSETKKLCELTAYMEAYGYEVLPAFMLDLVPDAFNTSISYRVGQDPLEHSSYFINSYHFYDSEYPPHRRVLGGIRKLVFGERHVPIEKHPLVKGGLNVKFLDSSHYTTSAIPSDITAALLHFKFLGDSFTRFKDVQKNETRRISCNRRHINYKKLESHLSERFMQYKEDIVKFQSSTQLVDLNLIYLPKPFKEISFKKTNPLHHYHEAIKALSRQFFKAATWHIRQAFRLKPLSSKPRATCYY